MHWHQGPYIFKGEARKKDGFLAFVKSKSSSKPQVIYHITCDHTSRVAVVTPTNRFKSVRNRCVIEVLEAFLCCQVAFRIFSVGAGAFVICLSQISSFFSSDILL